jgi:hypothetical protein
MLVATATATGENWEGSEFKPSSGIDQNIDIYTYRQ